MDRPDEALETPGETRRKPRQSICREPRPPARAQAWSPQASRSRCFGLTVAAGAQGAVRSVHGDWQIRCDTPPGAQGEQCALIQSVVAEDRSNAGLHRHRA